MVPGLSKYFLVVMFADLPAQAIGSSSIYKAGSGPALYVPCPNGANCLAGAKPWTLSQCKALEISAMMRAVMWLEVRQTEYGSMSASPTHNAWLLSLLSLLPIDMWFLHRDSIALRLRFLSCQLAERVPGPGNQLDKDPWSWKMTFTRYLDALYNYFWCVLQFCPD